MGWSGALLGGAKSAGVGGINFSSGVVKPISQGVSNFGGGSYIPNGSLFDSVTNTLNSGLNFAQRAGLWDPVSQSYQEGGYYTDDPTAGGSSQMTTLLMYGGLAILAVYALKKIL